LVGKLFADTLQVVYLPQNNVDAFQHVCAGFGDALNAFTVASENFNPQFILEFNDGL